MLIAKNSPTPIEVQVAIAERTEDIRLLQMANILPRHEPIKLAEKIGMLDVVSDGRVEVGVGTGSGDRQTQIFNRYRRDTPIDREENKEIFLERLEILVNAWTMNSFSYHGKFHDVPPEGIKWGNNAEYQYLEDEVSESSPDEFLNIDTEPWTLESIGVFPQPVQNPHPQLWRPISSVRTAIWAAQHGINGCTYCTDFSWVKKLVEAYYNAAEKAAWPDRRREYYGQSFNYGWDEQRRRGLVSQMLIFNTEIAGQESIERYNRGLECLMTVRMLDNPTEEVDGTAIDADEYVEENDAPIVGDSEEIIDQLAKFRDLCGYEDFIVFPTIGVPGMTHEDKLEQMRVFAEEIIPYFSRTAMS